MLRVECQLCPFFCSSHDGDGFAQFKKRCVRMHGATFDAPERLCFCVVRFIAFSF